jgi:Spy/CpxP family protein refolding chaperone
MSKHRLLIALTAVVLTASSNATQVSPYAGQEQREVKSLSEQEVNDYLAGKGMGLAKAAELNGYPGPLHVLELADRLKLTAEQRKRTEALFSDMKSKAVAAGQALINEERALNALFASKSVTPASLKSAVDRVAARQAQVRFIHLETHLAQLRVLSPQQVAAYNELRGYSSAAPQTHKHGHH